MRQRKHPLMRLKLLTSVAALLTVTACVSDHMNQGLNALIGQNIRVAVEKLGYPDSQRTMLGDNIYIWSTHSGGGAVAAAITPTMSVAVPLNFNCTIQIAVQANIIKNITWRGDPDGCRAYARALGGGFAL